MGQGVDFGGKLLARTLSLGAWGFESLRPLGWVLRFGVLGLRILGLGGLGFRVLGF